MSKVYTYASPYGAWTVNLGTDTVRLGSEQGYGGTAEAGGVGTGSVVLDDPDADVGHAGDAILGWQLFTIDENACAVGSQRLATYYTGVRRYYRGSGDSLITQSARKIEVSLLDLNAILGFRKGQTADWDRPAETAGERLTWVLASAELTGLIFDNGLVVYPTTAMDACDYRQQSPGDVFADCALHTHSNYFAYWDEAAGQNSLWFDDALTSTTYAASLRLSNALEDRDEAGGTYMSVNGVLTRDPGRVFAGVSLPFDGGVTYQTRAATADTFAWRDGIAPNANVKTTDAAAPIALQFLEDNASEDDRITCDVDLPASVVTGIQYGQLLYARFTHLPGYDEFRAFRVTSCTPTQTNETDARYLVKLQITPVTPVNPTVSHARVMRPNDNDPVTALSFHVLWSYDGDDPKSGDAADPKYGLVDYYPVGTMPVDGWSGLVTLGAGTVDLDCRVTAVGVADGATGAILTIKVNGTGIATASDSDGRAGLHSQFYDVTVTAPGVSLSTSDVIEAYFDFSGSWPIAPVIPSGVGIPEARLTLTGPLA